MQPEPPTKEVTILGQSQEIREMLTELQGRLDSHFSRSDRDCEAKVEAPVIPNVLDEIIKELEDNRSRLFRIMSFISSDVLPKIG